jgi:hypothetical protein
MAVCAFTWLEIANADSKVNAMTVKKMRTTLQEKEQRRRDCMAAPIFCNAKVGLALIAGAIRTDVLVRVQFTRPAFMHDAQAAQKP